MCDVMELFSEVVMQVNYFSQSNLAPHVRYTVHIAVHINALAFKHCCSEIPPFILKQPFSINMQIFILSCIFPFLVCNYTSLAVYE